MHACLIQRVPWQASCLTDYIEETTFCSARQRPRKHTTFQELLRWSAKCMLCGNMPECILESTCPHSDTLDKPSNSSSFQAIRPLCSAMPSHFVLLMLVVVCERHNVPQLFVEKNLYHQGESVHCQIYFIDVCTGSDWNGSLIRASEWTKYWRMSGEHIISYE